MIELSVLPGMGLKGERLWGGGQFQQGPTQSYRKGGKVEERNKSEGGRARNG